MLSHSLFWIGSTISGLALQAAVIVSSRVTSRTRANDRLLNSSIRTSTTLPLLLQFYLERIHPPSCQLKHPPRVYTPLKSLIDDVSLPAPIPTILTPQLTPCCLSRSPRSQPPNKHPRPRLPSPNQTTLERPSRSSQPHHFTPLYRGLLPLSRE